LAVANSIPYVSRKFNAPQFQQMYQRQFSGIEYDPIPQLKHTA
jgi:hypothetical protein